MTVRMTGRVVLRIGDKVVESTALYAIYLFGSLPKA